MKKLLIVADNVAGIQRLLQVFAQDYYCLAATSADEAITILDRHDVAAIVVDQEGIATSDLNLLKISGERRPLAMRILLSAFRDVDSLVESVNSGLVHGYVRKPLDIAELKLVVDRAVLKHEQKKRQDSLVIDNARLQLRIKQTKLTTVRSLAAVLKMKNEHTYSRSVRVSEYADVLAEDFMLNEDLRDDLKAASLLHEISVITLSEQSHTGSGLPSQTEFDLKATNSRTAQMLSCFPELLDAADIVRFQLENYDGSGRPFGLRGEQIPIGSRILRVASEYDRLTIPRDLSMAVSHAEAIRALRERGSQDLDGRVINALSSIEMKEQNGYRHVARIAAEVQTVSVAVH
jgi:Response regulator containing a CheY-like receiver domain and an HD-GYP domain